MEGLLDQIGSWFEQGRSVAVATVTRTWRSSPRPVGSMMAITEQGEIFGSVSGGCVESAVIDTAQKVLKEGNSQRLHFGVANEEAWEVGLSCGGEIDVFVRKFTDDNLVRWREAWEQGKRFWIALVIDGAEPYTDGDWCVLQNGEILNIAPQIDYPPDLKEAVERAASGGISKSIILDSDQISEVFVQVVDPPRQLILVGGVHIAQPLASLADTLGFEVIIVDPRRLFGTPERFPAVKAILGEWPQEAFSKLTLTESTAVVMLTHDPKIDDPAITLALNSPAFYLGALGSLKTHQKRMDRLVGQGLDPEDLRRLHAPVGLDLGAVTPEEIALAIMAEIVQVWHEGD